MKVFISYSVVLIFFYLKGIIAFSVTKETVISFVGFQMQIPIIFGKNSIIVY